MVAVPPTAPVPVTTPVVGFTEAMELLLLLHVPPGVRSLSVVVRPKQTTGVPSIGVGLGLTVNISVAIQPNGEVAVMVTVPGAMPVTRPVLEFMVAIPELLLVQVTPAVASVSVVVRPTHTLSIPWIGEVTLTVTTAVIIQPAGVV